MGIPSDIILGAVYVLLTAALAWLIKHYFARMERRLDKGDEKFDLLTGLIMTEQSDRKVCRAEMEVRVTTVEKDTVDHVMVYHTKGSLP